MDSHSHEDIKVSGPIFPFVCVCMCVWRGALIYLPVVGCLTCAATHVCTYSPSVMRLYYLLGAGLFNPGPETPQKGEVLRELE